MNKKLIALAVAGATLAPAAMAQTANPVTLYGRAWVMFENVKADGGTAAPLASRNRVNSNGASLIGFRGTEDLGGGLKAFFQMETEFRLDQNDLANYGTRNSGVGLQGDFGSVLLGRWDTPFKVAGSSIDPFGTTTIAGYTAAMSDRANFDRREQNVVQYWTPNFSGFTMRGSYAANEGKTATTNPSSISVGAYYTNGPLYLVSSWEKHKDQFSTYASRANGQGNSGAVTGGAETGIQLGGTVTFGPLRVGALVQKFKKDGGTFGGGTTVTSDQKAQMFNLIYTAGKNQFIYQLLRSKDGATRATPTTAVAEPDTKVNSLAYFYNFTRRTTFMTIYSMTKNNVAGLGNFGYANTLGNLTIAPDQDPRGFAIGLRHTF